MLLANALRRRSGRLYALALCRGTCSAQRTGDVHLTNAGETAIGPQRGMRTISTHLIICGRYALVACAGFQVQAVLIITALNVLADAEAEDRRRSWRPVYDLTGLFLGRGAVLVVTGEILGTIERRRACLRIRNTESGPIAVVRTRIPARVRKRSIQACLASPKIITRVQCALVAIEITRISLLCQLARCYAIALSITRVERASVAICVTGNAIQGILQENTIPGTVAMVHRTDVIVEIALRALR
jgi:hypothetical protein